MQSAPIGALCISGGESGIRTHGSVTTTAVFKTAALNHSAISPELVICCKARVAHHYGSFASGILPLAPSGPAAAPLSASASCLRVKTAALNRSAISPELDLLQGTRCAPLRQFCFGHPALRPFGASGCAAVRFGILP